MVFAAHSRETLIDFLEKSRDILRDLPEEEHSYFLEQGVDLAAHDPAVSFQYFVHLPKIRREIGRDRFPPWYREGVSQISRSLPAARAYFGLESRRSKDRAGKKGSSVSLEEVCRPLKLFAQALTGRILGLRPRAELQGGFQNPLAPLPCTDGETIYLPGVMRDFSTPETNFLAYKLATAHQAGYVELGTFQFKLSSVGDLFPPDFWSACLRGISAKGKTLSSLEAFFHFFPAKNLAVDLFTLLEGARIDHGLRREYRGLKKEMDILLPLAWERRPALSSLPLKEAVLESLLRITTFDEYNGSLPWPVASHLEDLRAVLTPLRQEGATVKDSARATVLLYRWLSSLPNIRSAALEAESGEKTSLKLPRPLLSPGGVDLTPRAARDEEPYRGLTPLPHWGELRPELVQKKMRLREIQGMLHKMEMGAPLSPEVLQELLEKGLEGELEIIQGKDGEGFQGLFVTDLKGLKGAGAVQDAAQQAKERLQGELRSLLGEVGEDPGGIQYYYDEWDYQIRDYRVRWCCLKEREMEAGTTGFVDQTLESYSDLVAEVRKQFQMLKPERFKKIPHLERGEEIDLNAAIEASLDRRAGQSPSEKIYIERNRKDRDFSTLFLLDMSASTDEWVEGKGKKAGGPSPSPGEKRVIDIEKEALVVMAEALEEIGDEYAIFGFSGYGRKEVDFYCIKDFGESYGDGVKGRIDKIKPQRSTRMGPAIRHALEKIEGRESKVKNLILISDGYPQDYDYGDDRSDKEYALQDTLIALQEAARKNIHTFCITVDRAGHDYLRKMFAPSQYLVIEETTALPGELPKIYRRLTA